MTVCIPSGVIWYRSPLGSLWMCVRHSLDLGLVVAAALPPGTQGWMLELVIMGAS